MDRVPPDYAERQVTSVVNYFALAGSLAAVATVLFAPNVLQQLPFYVVLLLMAGVARLALRRGLVRAVGWTMVLGLQAVLVVASLLFGGIDGTALLAWSGAVTVAAVTLGWREGLLTALVGSAFALGFLGLALGGWTPMFSTSAVERGLTLVATQVTTAVWTGSAVAWLAKALHDAQLYQQRAAAALRERDQELERRIRVEDELREAVQTVEAASQSKSRFLANMSHELRTPLNAIIGYAEILIEEQVGDPSDLERIRSSGRHLLGLINDVLDLSKIEADQLRLVTEELDMDALVADVLAGVKGLAAASGNVLVLDVPERLGVVVGDPTRIRQVLLNLLANAFKFTDRGEVCLAARRLGAEGEERLVVEVRDTGIGIDPGLLPRLFRPFVQADDTTSRRFGGTGLGLALSRRLAEMMEGTLTVDSTLGKGSTFTFVLPVRGLRSQVARLAEERLGRVRADGPPAVLCVDDDPAALILLDRLLCDEPFLMIPCLDPRQVVALAARVQPVAVTIDLHMPGVDGLQLFDRLRAEPATAHLPVVVVSVDHDRGQAHPLAAERWLTKPVDRTTLLRALNDRGPVG